MPLRWHISTISVVEPPLPKGVAMPIQVRIDRQGRVVIPLGERERLGLDAGTTLELVPTPEGLLLERRQRAEVVEAADGAPLIRLAGKPPVTNVEAQRAIDQVRDGA
jgi:AbrB family looped-hinge helix DNA binding protein